MASLEGKEMGGVVKVFIPDLPRGLSWPTKSNGVGSSSRSACLCRTQTGGGESKEVGEPVQRAVESGASAARFGGGLA